MDLHDSRVAGFKVRRVVFDLLAGAAIEFFFEGMTFDVTYADDSKLESITAEICLGTEETKPASNVEILSGAFYLMPPLPDDLRDMTPLQASVIADLIAFYGFLPVEEVFGTPLAEIVSQAILEDDVCLTVDVDG